MKNRFRALFTAVFLITLPLKVSASATIKAAVEHWPPWEIALDANKQEVSQGLAIDITREILARLGYSEIELKTLPWKRAIYNTQKGSIDIIPMISRTDEREKYLLFTESIYIDPLIIIYSSKHTPDFQWQTLQDLKPYTIGTVDGFSYGIFNQAVTAHNLNIEKARTDAQNIRKIIAGRFELAVMYYSVYKNLSQDIPEETMLRHSSKPLNQVTFHFAVSKKSQLADKINDINNIIVKIKEDGTMKRILGEYYSE